jgi:hypothetical protein
VPVVGAFRRLPLRAVIGHPRRERNLFRTPRRSDGVRRKPPATARPSLAVHCEVRESKPPFGQSGLAAIQSPGKYHRGGKSAIEAVRTARERCWRYDWVLDLDIRGFFDSIEWELMLRAVRHHTDCAWVEPNKRMRDKAAHACRALCRVRVADELQRRRETRIGEHLKLVLSIIDRQVH